MSVTHILEAKLDGASITITDPRDGRPVGTVASATAADVDAAVVRANAAAGAWSRLPSEERGAMVRHAAGLVAAHAAELAQLNTRETGRPTEEALQSVQAGVRTLLQYAELGPLHRGHSLRGTVDAADYTIPEPRGVVLALTPWNDPVATTAGLVGAALVTGNTVIHKPSERCPASGSAPRRTARPGPPGRRPADPPRRTRGRQRSRRAPRHRPHRARRLHAGRRADRAHGRLHR